MQRDHRALGHSVSLPLVGGIDLSVFGGEPDKRLVIKDSQTSHASSLQDKMTKAYKADLFGVSGLYRQPGMPNNVCWVGWFGIRPRFRRQGFGTNAMYT